MKGQCGFRCVRTGLRRKKRDGLVAPQHEVAVGGDRRRVVLPQLLADPLEGDGPLEDLHLQDPEHEVAYVADEEVALDAVLAAEPDRAQLQEVLAHPEDELLALLGGISVEDGLVRHLRLGAHDHEVAVELGVPGYRGGVQGRPAGFPELARRFVELRGRDELGRVPDLRPGVRFRALAEGFGLGHEPRPLPGLLLSVVPAPEDDLLLDDPDPPLPPVPAGDLELRLLVDPRLPLVAEPPEVVVAHVLVAGVQQRPLPHLLGGDALAVDVAVALGHGPVAVVPGVEPPVGDVYRPPRPAPFGLPGHRLGEVGPLGLVARVDVRVYRDEVGVGREAEGHDRLGPALLRGPLPPELVLPVDLEVEVAPVVVGVGEVDAVLPGGRLIEEVLDLPPAPPQRLYCAVHLVLREPVADEVFRPGQPCGAL